MSSVELRALATLRPHWAPGPEDVWRPAPFHVEGLHRSAERTVASGIDDAVRSTGSNPIGVALIGQGGAGKTHFLGWTRRQVQDRGGYFFLIELADPDRFWDSVMASVRVGLAVRPASGETQLQIFLRRLLSRVGLPAGRHGELLGYEPLRPDTLDAFISELRAQNPPLIRECQDTLRALVLFGAVEAAAQDIAQTYLTSAEEQEPGERAAWRIRREVRPAQRLLREVSLLLAVTGPTVTAVDQLDPILAPLDLLDEEETPEQRRHLVQLDLLAAGLMQLREQTRRTLTVIACLPETWDLISRKAIGTVRDRFVEASPLQTIPDEVAGRALVAKRFAPQFAEVGFVPPYDTWPVRPEAFATVRTYTPRRLLTTIDAHVRRCLDAGEVAELHTLDDIVAPTTARQTRTGEPVGIGTLGVAGNLDTIDDLFARAKATAHNAIQAALDPVSEDDSMPSLLNAGLRAWTIERDAADRYELDVPTRGKPLLHARLRLKLKPGSEREAHWAFRSISAAHWKSVAVRVENARLKAGHNGTPGRALFLLREADDWPTQPSVRRAMVAFERDGGRRLRLARDDLAVFAALRALFNENLDGLDAWLRERAPASATQLLRDSLGDGDGETTQPAGSPLGGPSASAEPVPTAMTNPAQTASTPRGARSTCGASNGGKDQPPAITLGTVQEPVRIELTALRKHVAIFAGSGSGKTVLIRRIVEECALQGVSAIVLDPNNDLARLGDQWPNSPTAWGPGDSEKADRYFAGTDVVVWTPMWASGRPLIFQPLPDFAGVLSDIDEFNQAVEVAVTALASRAKVDGETTKALHSRAVLKEALRSFAQRGLSRLDRFVDFLAELPEGTSRMIRASTLAADMAETLTAAMVNDPLFGDGGAPLDPAVLLTPVAGKRARISVISFVGLPSDAQRQSFVNQLQMALFGWIKRHPAGERPLGGLFVMDEAQTLAPSGAMTACTASTVALASQARKYGLGLVFATQAPKGLHNRISGNATTQFFGLLNSPIQIAAAREMAQAKGGDVPDISRLRTGQFYVAREGAPFVKAQAPLCLSHHPASPLTGEEVVSRARRD